MKNIQTVISKEKDCAGRFYVFSQVNTWSLIYNMVFTNIIILFPFQMIDLSRSRSQKGYQKIYCYIHFGPAEILHNSLFCGLFIFLSFTLCDPCVFDFKCNRSTMSWGIVNLHVHSYIDLQSSYFSFVATLFPNILPTVFALLWYWAL